MFKKLKNISLDDWRFMLEYGKPTRKASIFDLRNGLLEKMEPVFFLSTGRAGTMWFSELIKQDKSVKVLHHPNPDFAVQNAKAYKHYQLKELKENTIEEWLGEVFLAGREHHLRFAYKTNRRLVETNNGITFFAYSLAQLFPRAKFIHLVRPPKKFIISGMRRGYYSDHPQEMRRIRPAENSAEWNKFRREEKIAWLWSETNSFIREFGKNIEQDRFKRFVFDELKEENVSEILDFANINYKQNSLRKLLNKPVNAQKKSPVESEDINWAKAEQIFKSEALKSGIENQI